jgi:hypothetical protein
MLRLTKTNLPNPARAVDALVPARRLVGALLFATLAACAGSHEEPPAPPPPPVDPTAFSGPARTPAPEVDLSANADASNPWVDADAPAAAAATVDAGSTVADAGTDAQPPGKKRKR